MNVQVEITEAKPDYMPLARVLLEDVRTFFEDPENEREFREWMKTRETGKGA